ncbi:MAG: thioredoxin [Candidatus Omnitrophota bacterium]
MGVVRVTDENFKKEVLDEKMPCLVDFWADWCGPCKKISPLVDDIAVEYNGKMKVAKMNIDEGKKTASSYGVMSIPMIMFFKDGKVLGQVIGAIGRSELKAKIEEHLD